MLNTMSMDNIEMSHRVCQVFSVEGSPSPPEIPPPPSRRFTSPFIDEAIAKRARSRFFKDYTHFIRGLRVAYLGHVPCETAHNEYQHVSFCVEKLLDKCNMIESQVQDVFLELDARAGALAMHYVDECARITRTRHFPLRRIALCSSGHGGDPALFTWVYREETLSGGFQMECHAVRCTNERRLAIIAGKLYAAFKQLSSPPQNGAYKKDPQVLHSQVVSKESEALRY